MLQIVDQSACNHAPTLFQNGAEPKEADCIPVFSSDLIYRIMRKRNQSTKKPIWKLHLMKYSPMFGRLANSTNSLTLNGSHNFMSKSECWCNICIKPTLISYGRKLYYCINERRKKLPPNGLWIWIIHYCRCRAWDSNRTEIFQLYFHLQYQSKQQELETGRNWNWSKTFRGNINAVVSLSHLTSLLQIDEVAVNWAVFGSEYCDVRQRWTLTFSSGQRNEIVKT